MTALHRLSTYKIERAHRRLVQDVLQHLDHDPDVSSGAINLYIQMLLSAKHDSQTCIDLQEPATRMQATTPTIRAWLAELEWSGVAYMECRSQREYGRLSTLDELRALRATPRRLYHVR